MTNEQFDRIMSDPSKVVYGDTVWTPVAYRGLVITFRVDIQSESSRSLSIHGRFQRRRIQYGFSLVHAEVGRIYGIDVGEPHHNPTCNRIGSPHEHRWSERYNSKFAVEIATWDDHVPPLTVWKRFCGQARIDFRGRITFPAESGA